VETPAWRSRVDAAKRLKLFVVGVLIGVGMFFVGGIAVVPARSTSEPTAALSPWLQKTMCAYPVLVCTSHGAVVTTRALASSRH
jgi:hypothetical protein